MSKFVSKVWSVTRWVLCFVTAFLNACAIGFHGNGNLVFSGLFIGLILGLVWSVLLLFALPILLRKFRLSLKAALLAALLIAALLLLPIVSFRLWGYAIQFHPWN